MLWSLVEGWMVCPACVVTEAVKDTEVFPAVPDEMYPAVTCGVLLTEDLVRVIVPFPTVFPAPVAEMDAAGVALPDAMVLVALSA